eukprot:1755209-Lingulodinium_polyedra.AAC.1
MRHSALEVRCPACGFDELGVGRVAACVHGLSGQRHRGCGAPCPHGRWYNGRDFPGCPTVGAPVILDAPPSLPKHV